MPAEGGIRFGQYVLLRRLARGGMAEVFLAQQRGLEGFDRRVAVKRILPHLSDSPDFTKMFLGEAKLAAQLTHPNVVHIYDFGKVDGDYFIAMEFVDGVHAGQLFKHSEHELMPPALVARVGADAASALHYAHDLRGPAGKPLTLVHRDVSPANIMISYDGVVKLCDFGIAKAAALSDQLTNPGQVKGKYAYMSPEQTIASQLDGRSDVFSLAIVLWELLSGKVIVPRGDAIEAMRAIRDGKLDPIEKVAPHVPPPLAKAIGWALQPKREARASAFDLAQALETFIKSSPELATSMQLGAWVRQRFPREQTGQVPALEPGPNAPGTVASPSTMAAPGTASISESQGPLTPPVDELKATAIKERPKAQRVQGFGSDLDEEGAQTLKRRPQNMPFARGDATVVDDRASERAADEATLRDRAEQIAQMGDGATTVIDEHPRRGMPTPVVSYESMPETVERARRPSAGPPASIDTGSLPADATIPLGPKHGARGKATGLPPMGGPANALPPTGVTIVPAPGASGPRDVPMSGARPIPGSGPRNAPYGGQYNIDTERRPRPLPSPAELERKRKLKMAGMIAGLAGLTLISFSIALCASGGGGSRHSAMTLDAGSTIAMTAMPPPAADAAAVVPADAASVAPTFPTDAMPTTLFVVKTIPPGGSVHVGEQGGARVAPAEFALGEGTYDVTAELPGYQSEHRSVEVPRGERYEIEIAFTHKLASTTVHLERGPATGVLTVSTQPYSDVYEGSKLLGETPLADLSLPPGPHTLTFKNPKHGTITKTITITPGKNLKLSFPLP